MNIRSLASAVVVAAMVLGCAAPRNTVMPGRPCADGACKVTVTVVQVGGETKVVADPEILHPPPGNSQVITWVLDAPGYKFREESIVPHTGAPTGYKTTTTQADWNAQITYLNNNDTRYMVRKNMFTADQKRLLYYDVVIFDRATNTPHRLDPAIMND